MPSEDRYILTPKGRRTTNISYGTPGVDTSLTLEDIVRTPSLEILQHIRDYGPSTLEDFVDEFVGERDYLGDDDKIHSLSVDPSDIRQGLRQLYEAGLVERMDQ